MNKYANDEIGIDELNRLLNDRKNYKTFYDMCKVIIEQGRASALSPHNEKVPAGTVDLSGDEIFCLIEKYSHSRIYVEGYAGDDLGRMSVLEGSFERSEVKKMVYIMNSMTTGGGSDWFAVLADRDNGLTLAESVNIDRKNNPRVLELCNSLFKRAEANSR